MDVERVSSCSRGAADWLAEADGSGALACAWELMTKFSYNGGRHVTFSSDKLNFPALAGNQPLGLSWAMIVFFCVFLCRLFFPFLTHEPES